MSEVISFRLDKANPREAQALEVLSAWVEKEFSVRFILTKVLLELDHPGPELSTSQDDPGLNLIIEQIGQLLEMVKTIKGEPIPELECSQEEQGLNEMFLASVRHGAKPGLKLE